MTALPANVHFAANPDGWTLDDSEDAIRSVQSFLTDSQLNVELWGTTTALSPADRRYEHYEFQQNVWVELPKLSWSARRIVYGIVDDTHYVGAGITFTREGTAAGIPQARRV